MPLVLIGLLLPLAPAEMAPGPRDPAKLSPKERETREHLLELLAEIRRDGDPELTDLQEEDVVVGRSVGGYVQDRWVSVYVPAGVSLAAATPVACCLSPCAVITLPCGLAIGGSVKGVSTLSFVPIVLGAIYGACWPLIVADGVRGMFADTERRAALRALLEEARSGSSDEQEGEPPSNPMDVLLY